MADLERRLLGFWEFFHRLGRHLGAMVVALVVGAPVVTPSPPSATLFVSRDETLVVGVPAVAMMVEVTPIADVPAVIFSVPAAIMTGPPVGGMLLLGVG